MDSKAEPMEVPEEQTIVEQIPTVVKSHLPPHLQPRTKKPLEASKEVNNTTTHASTPAIVKRRQMNKWFNSPTDAFLSPCTQKLMKPKHETQAIEALNFDENDDQKQMSTVE